MAVRFPQRRRANAVLGTFSKNMAQKRLVKPEQVWSAALVRSGTIPSHLSLVVRLASGRGEFDDRDWTGWQRNR